MIPEPNPRLFMSLLPSDSEDISFYVLVTALRRVMFFLDTKSTRKTCKFSSLEHFVDTIHVRKKCIRSDFCVFFLRQIKSISDQFMIIVATFLSLEQMSFPEVFD